MHHFIYPTQDTYITNRTGLVNKNFGIDEILQVGTSNIVQSVLNSTKDYYYLNDIFNGQGFGNFNGIFTGSFGGSASFSVGTISGSGLEFSASYFSGSIDGIIQELSASVISGSEIIGTISGSLLFPYLTGIFLGQLTGSNACLTGTGSGTETINEQNWTTNTVQFVDRSLLKFDIKSISASISNGEILSPSFFLKLKVCNEYDLPITYTLYALPVSQSWEKGDGYWSDGGSDSGVSWKYRDFKNGNSWFSQSLSSSRNPIDFINNPSLSTASFAYGGGTWFTSSVCSQSFDYKSSDVYMNITPMVMEWINGNYPNEGLIIVSSDELVATGSGFVLKFFSRDTNTIYSPCLDVAWNDSIFTTGSLFTSSVSFITNSSGISASLQSGSVIFGGTGVSGSFSGSTSLVFTTHYITATDQIFDYSAPNSIVNDYWWANNGYHYDSWYTAWQLDPYHGGFLPNTDITYTPIPYYGSPPVYQFTGSFTGSFYGTASVNGTISGSDLLFSASYFTGSIDGIDTETSGAISGSLIEGTISESVMATSMIGVFTGQLTSSFIYLNGTGSGTYLDSTFVSMTGFVIGKGLSGNILGLPVFGSITGFLTVSQSLVTGSCGKSFSASLAKAIFNDGPYSGSSFTAYYVDYKFENALLTGSWNDNAWLGAKVTIPIPSGIDPYAYAYVNGSYINGTALGIYTISGSISGSIGSDSASFNGQFINGNAVGSWLRAQLSGSVYTSSFITTGSVEKTSSILFPLDSDKSFTISIQNLLPEYRAGDIVKIGVFGRRQFPLKTFGKTTQQQQYMTPEFLPSASYYALKDNQTEEIVLNFDSYTQLSCEYPYGNYFIVDTTGLPQERYYRVLIRVNNGSEIYTIDTGKTFKIVRGGEV